MNPLPPLALYVHIPWCVKKCPYCDFNSHRASGALPVDAYVAALLADLARDAALAEGRRIDSVFFGGGTPSLFPPEAIARILDGADRILPFAADVEITLEANPGTIEHGRFDGYRAAGVNRVSFGVQSFDDAALRRIGRIHGGEEARRAVAEARAAGIDNVNIDLMYALPGQTVDAAIADLDAALALAPTHLSHYQLTIEPNTEFAKRPPPMLPDDDEVVEIEEAATRALKAAGFARYETSAYARPGRRCRHNLAYWTFADYLGIGAGAHGKLSRSDSTIVRTTKLKVPQHYLARAASGAAFGSAEPVAPAELPFEFMLNALRLVDGFDLSLYAARTGLDPTTIEGPLTFAVEHGWITLEANHVSPTALGRRFLNDVIQLFMP